MAEDVAGLAARDGDPAAGVNTTGASAPPTTARSASTALRTWAQFLASPGPSESAFMGALVDGRIDRYQVEEVRTVRGRPLPELSARWLMTRVESQGAIASSSAAIRLEGVAQHTLYTTAAERTELERISRAEGPGLAVLIPITKSPAWWRLAQDERNAYFHHSPAHEGHTAIGSRYAPRIHRRLYQARTIPGSTWDFLTYFEMTAADVDVFREMLAHMRDPARNPEWQFVDREVEIWMSKRSAAPARPRGAAGHGV